MERFYALLSRLAALTARRLGVRGRECRDSFLRQAARKPSERVPEDPYLRWAPDGRPGGWRLDGRYLPRSDDSCCPDPTPEC